MNATWGMPFERWRKRRHCKIPIPLPMLTSLWWISGAMQWHNIVVLATAWTFASKVPTTSAFTFENLKIARLITLEFSHDQNSFRLSSHQRHQLAEPATLELVASHR
jgi:hypothetical protein